MWDIIAVIGMLVVFIGGWRLVARKVTEISKSRFIGHLIAAPAALVASLAFVAILISLGLIDDGSSNAPAEVESASEPTASDIVAADPVAEAAPDDAISIDGLYSILSDEGLPPAKRTVEVLLYDRVDEVTLESIGRAIKAEGEQDVERTFIGYRLDGQDPESAYWGTTHYNPDIAVRIQGLSLEQYETLAAYGISDNYESPIGSWFSEMGGGINYLSVAYIDDGHFYIDNVFPSEGRNTYRYDAARLDDGSLRLQEPDDEFGEYFIIDSDGTLQLWSESGLFRSISANEFFGLDQASDFSAFVNADSTSTAGDTEDDALLARRSEIESGADLGITSEEYADRFNALMQEGGLPFRLDGAIDPDDVLAQAVFSTSFNEHLSFIGTAKPDSLMMNGFLVNGTGDGTPESGELMVAIFAAAIASLWADMPIADAFVPVIELVDRLDIGDQESTASTVFNDLSVSLGYSPLTGAMLRVAPQD